MVDLRLIIYEEHLRVRLLSMWTIQRNYFRVRMQRDIEIIRKNDIYWEYDNFWTIFSDR